MRFCPPFPILAPLHSLAHPVPHTELTGKMNLVDLAGSENNKLTGNDASRMAESAAINKSLSVLGQVVHALNTNQVGATSCYTLLSFRVLLAPSSFLTALSLLSSCLLPLCSSTTLLMCLRRCSRFRTQTRIPYRNSKLTRILQDALGGSSVGLLICNIAPGVKFRQDTLNTLK